MLRKDGYDVIALCVDVGQESELDGVRVRAEAAGVRQLNDSAQFGWVFREMGASFSRDKCVRPGS